jgi:hypothetical protein
MSAERKNQIISSFVTALIMMFVFILLYVLGLYSQVPPPPSRDYILLEFTSGGGGGGGSEISRSKQNTSGSAPDLATQDVEEAPVVTPNPNPTPSQSENAAVAEAKPEPGATYRPGSGGGSGGGRGTGSGTGLGTGTGSGEGSGAGSGKGIGYGSGNRGYVNIPDVNINESGVVYVEVHVTAQGSVIGARILSSSKYPTTITNAKIQQECIARALNAKYVTGKEELRIIVFK